MAEERVKDDPSSTGAGTAEAGDAEAASATRRDGKDDVNGSATRTGKASVTDECRRLAELLHLDAVGVVSTASGRRRVAWWAAPSSPPLPSRLDDILQGRVEGWIVSPLPQGTVFARMTPASSVRSASILKTLGPSLVAAAEGEGAARTDTGPEDTAGGVPFPGRHRSRKAGPEVRSLERAADATRRALALPAATLPDLLEAVREAIGAEELFYLSTRHDEIEVVAAPDGKWPHRIPPEVRGEFSGLPLTDPIDDATARQLGVVLGVGTPHLSAAFCGETEPMEAVIAAWQTGPALADEPMRVIARVVAAGRAAIEARGRAVDALMHQERTRWAYGIHDGLIQAVTTAVLELEGLRGRIENDPQEAIDILDTTKAEIRKTLGELRDMLFELSEDKGPGVAPEEPLTQYVQDVVRRWRLPARVSVEGALHAIPRPALEAAYVVIRESLANAAKHSSSRDVAVTVRASRDEVLVEVQDGGRGFATGGRGRRGKHFGLEMMRKRVEEAGGSLEIDSSPGRGTRVVARLPVRSEGDRP